jgi:hypothetical protein
VKRIHGLLDLLMRLHTLQLPYCKLMSNYSSLSVGIYRSNISIVELAGSQIPSTILLVEEEQSLLHQFLVLWHLLALHLLTIGASLLLGV